MELRNFLWKFFSTLRVHHRNTWNYFSRRWTSVGSYTSTIFSIFQIVGISTFSLFNYCFTTLTNNLRGSKTSSMLFFSLSWSTFQLLIHSHIACMAVWMVEWGYNKGIKPSLRRKMTFWIQIRNFMFISNKYMIHFMLD